jgi:hypothetical protein
MGILKEYHGAISISIYLYENGEMEMAIPIMGIQAMFSPWHI